MVCIQESAVRSLVKLPTELICIISFFYGQSWVGKGIKAAFIRHVPVICDRISLCPSGTGREGKWGTQVVFVHAIAYFVDQGLDQTLKYLTLP